MEKREEGEKQVAPQVFFLVIYGRGKNKLLFIYDYYFVFFYIRKRFLLSPLGHSRFPPDIIVLWLKLLGSAKRSTPHA